MFFLNKVKCYEIIAASLRCVLRLPSHCPGRQNCPVASFFSRFLAYKHELALKFSPATQQDTLCVCGLEARLIRLGKQ